MLLAACFTCTMHSDRVDAGVVAKDVDLGAPLASDITWIFPMMICQPLIDAKLLPNRNHCRRFHSAQGIRTPLRRRGVLRSDHGCPSPRADACKRCLHLSCGELPIISRTPTRWRIDYGLTANGLGYTSFGTRGSQVQILPLRPKTNLSFQIFVGGHRQLCSGCVAVECSSGSCNALRERINSKADLAHVHPLE